jgi:ABC-type branched-subunit amino acid transport system permease subunit
MTITAATLALGLTTGLGIGALALGLILVYRTSHVINLAQAELGAAAAAVTAALVRQGQLPFFLAAVLATAGAAATGALIDLVVIRRLRDAPRPVVLIATAGVTELLLALSIAVIDSISHRGGGYPLPIRATASVGLGVVLHGGDLVLLFLVPALALGLAAAGRFTKLGVAIRAGSDNPEAARLAGIPVGWLTTLVWAIAGAVAAVVAICLLAGQPIVGTESLGPEVLFEALAACVLARFVSLPRALAAGVAIGVVEQVVFYNWPHGGVRDLVLLVAVVAALVVQTGGGFRDAAASGWQLAGVWRPAPRALVERRWWRAVGPAGALFVLGLAALASRLATNSRTLIFTQIACYAILAISTTLIVGVAGHVSLGQVGFFGLGAAVSYQLSVSVGIPFWLAFLGAGAVAAVASVIVGIPALRMRGLLFAVTSLGFALVAQSWLLPQPWLIGAGVTVPRPILGPVDLAPERAYFVFALVVLAGAAWVAHNLLRSGPGRRMVAVRDNEAAAASFAVALLGTKLLAFAVAGFLAGVAGALYGHGLQSLSVNDFPAANPGLQIGAIDSLGIVAIAAIGGLGSVTGAVVAAGLIVGADQLTTNVALRLLVSSAGLLLVLLAVPGGLAGLVAPLRTQLHGWALRRVVGGRA